MLQILQNLKNGKTLVEDVPVPKLINNTVLVQSKLSLISSGTERMLVDFGKASLINKARSQPEKVKMVLDKIRTDGLVATADAVMSKLDQPLPLGYCNVGVVLESQNTQYVKGSRVVSNGPHAEVIRAPKNLVALIPDNVTDEEASFTVIGAIAMQGIRLANPRIGETVVVIGLGLIGLLTVQILIANGCRVIGIDFDSKKCNLAEKYGAISINLSITNDPESTVQAFTKNFGADAVIITASSKSNDVIHQAASISKKRGKIILVGVVGLDLDRADFYEKELTFQVSCSYGPGRYDEEYEDKGNDYPFAFVRWTEQRNFEAVLELMSRKKIDTKDLVSDTYMIDKAVEAYQCLNDNAVLGILLKYNSSHDLFSSNLVKLYEKSYISSGGNISFLGGGNYASRVLIPAFKKTNANLVTLVTSGGVNSIHHGKKNNFKNASTDENMAMTDETDAVVIATRHNLHASQVIMALKKNKHVFVEKPLALNLKDITEIEKTYNESNSILMIGFNRRFSPFVKKIKSLLENKKMPKSIIMTMNAGEIPINHWTQDAKIGGGRIIGEACHYIDLMRYLVNSKIKTYHAIKANNEDFYSANDIAMISLEFEDGSIGTINYLANGGKAFPKERIEIFCDNAVLQLDNFRKLKGYNWHGFNQMKSLRQKKGQSECVQSFMDSVVNGKPCPIPSDELFEVSKVTVQIVNQLMD